MNRSDFNQQLPNALRDLANVCILLRNERATESKCMIVRHQSEDVDGRKMVDLCRQEAKQQWSGTEVA